MRLSMRCISDQKKRKENESLDVRMILAPGLLGLPPSPNCTQNPTPHLNVGIGLRPFAFGLSFRYLHQAQAQACGHAAHGLPRRLHAANANVRKYETRTRAPRLSDIPDLSTNVTSGQIASGQIARLAGRDCGL